MKTTLSTIVIVVTMLFVSCKKEKADPPPVLPPITQEGKGTIGFVLANEIWVPGITYSLSRPAGAAEYSSTAGILNLYCNRKSIYSPSENDSMAFQFFKKNLVVGEYDLDGSNVSVYLSVLQKDGSTKDYDFNSTGKLLITRLDLVSRIVSGTFSFNVKRASTGEVLTATQGRFDMAWGN